MPRRHPMYRVGEDFERIAEFASPVLKNRAEVWPIYFVKPRRVTAGYSCNRLILNRSIALLQMHASCSLVQVDTSSLRFLQM